jgi:hypothetical protein
MARRLIELLITLTLGLLYPSPDMVSDASTRRSQAK